MIDEPITLATATDVYNFRVGSPVQLVLTPSGDVRLATRRERATRWVRWRWLRATPKSPQRRTGRPRSGIKPLPETTLGGVNIGKSAIETEVWRLQSITRGVGKRLRSWMYRNVDVLPDPDYVETLDKYSKIVLGLLKEQRERYKQAGGEGLSTEALEAQFRMEVLLALRTFTEQDWAVADKVRRERFGDGAWTPVVATSEEPKP